MGSVIHSTMNMDYVLNMKRFTNDSFRNEKCLCKRRQLRASRWCALQTVITLDKIIINATYSRCSVAVEFTSLFL